MVFKTTLFLSTAFSILSAGTVDALARDSSIAARAEMGPVEAEVVRVIDGDTIEVQAKIWIDQWIRTAVRLANVDTPELRSRCPSEKVAATAAKTLTERWLAAGPTPGRIILTEIRSGKYAGRILGQIERADGERLSAALIASGLARPYDGGPRFDWCR